MANVCPQCGIPGNGHLATHCSQCVDGRGAPIELVTPEVRARQLEAARERELRLREEIARADEAYEEPANHRSYALF